jgi:hypothetical protein
MPISGEWVDGAIFIPDGMYIPASSDNDGTARALLFDDDGNMMGPTKFRTNEPADDPEGDPEDDDESGRSPEAMVALALGLALAVVAVIAIKKKYPNIKAWWLDEVLPAVREKRLFKKKPELIVAEEENNEAAGNGMALVDRDLAAAFTTEIDEALADYRTNMSSDEAKQRLLAILAAAAVIAEQLRALFNARIQDADSPEVAELRTALEKLSTQQVADAINSMLQSDKSPLDDEATAEFVRMFGAGTLADGQFLPLRRDDILEALRISEDGRQLLPPVCQPEETTDRKDH